MPRQVQLPTPAQRLLRADAFDPSRGAAVENTRRVTINVNDKTPRPRTLKFGELWFVCSLEPGRAQGASHPHGASLVEGASRRSGERARV